MGVDQEYVELLRLAANEAVRYSLQATDNEVRRSGCDTLASDL